MTCYSLCSALTASASVVVFMGISSVADSGALVLDSSCLADGIASEVDSGLIMSWPNDSSSCDHGVCSAGEAGKCDGDGPWLAWVLPVGMSVPIFEGVGTKGPYEGSVEACRLACSAWGDGVMSVSGLSWSAFGDGDASSCVTDCDGDLSPEPVIAYYKSYGVAWA